MNAVNKLPSEENKISETEIKLEECLENKTVKDRWKYKRKKNSYGRYLLKMVSMDKKDMDKKDKDNKSKDNKYADKMEQI